MSTKLSERFKASQGAAIEVDGRLVHMMHELPPIEQAADLRIELDATAARPQGLRLKAAHGQVVLNNQALDDVVLWCDTAPPVVVATLRPDSEEHPMTLRVWNVWRDHVGTMQAWIGDAGIAVEHDSTVVLRCSDGFDEPRFDDLVVTLTLISN